MKSFRHIEDGRYYDTRRKTSLLKVKEGSTPIQEPGTVAFGMTDYL